MEFLSFKNYFYLISMYITMIVRLSHSLQDARQNVAFDVTVHRQSL